MLWEVVAALQNRGFSCVASGWPTDPPVRVQRTQMCLDKNTLFCELGFQTHNSTMYQEPTKKDGLGLVRASILAVVKTGL